MEKEDLDERAKQEIESEALLLERRVNTKKELASLKMSEDSYEKLMNTIWEKEKLKRKRRSLHRKTLATAATVALLITVAGLGVNGARLYVMEAVKQEDESIYDITTDADDNFYVNLTEEEAYDRIEEELGILALRLGNKPNGMELGDVFIDAEMGEAVMEFHYNNHVLSIYENKQSTSAYFQTHLDGEVVDTIELFYLGKGIEILKIDKNDGNIAYHAQLEYGNAFYHLISDMEITEIENILYGIIFINN